MGHKLSAALDTMPDDTNFNHGSMQILLPAEVVQRIRADAVNDFLSSIAERADGGRHSENTTPATERQSDSRTEMYHLDQPRELRPWTVRMCETVFDITLNTQHLCEAKRIVVEDSRELFLSILQWAREFEAKHCDEQSRDYIELIDEYAEDMLLGQYGTPTETGTEGEMEEIK